MYFSLTGRDLARRRCVCKTWRNAEFYLGTKRRDAINAQINACDPHRSVLQQALQILQDDESIARYARLVIQFKGGMWDDLYPTWDHSGQMQFVICHYPLLNDPLRYGRQPHIGDMQQTLDTLYDNDPASIESFQFLTCAVMDIPVDFLWGVKNSFASADWKRDEYSRYRLKGSDKGPRPPFPFSSESCSDNPFSFNEYGLPQQEIPLSMTFRSSCEESQYKEYKELTV